MKTLMRRAAAAFEVLAYAIDPDHDLVTYRETPDGYELAPVCLACERRDCRCVIEAAQ